MAIDNEKTESDSKKAWIFCKLPFWQSNDNSNGASGSSGSSSTTWLNGQSSNNNNHHSAVAAMAKSLIPTRRRLRLDPPNKLYFPYEPGKQVRSAIEIKNVSKTHVAFKFQTTVPKSCYMRPPGGVLAPGESLIATVFKFVEPPENDEKPFGQNSRAKFKSISIKVNGDMEYIPEMFEEQKDQVSVEQILRVVFLDPENPNHLMEKLKRQLAEADAALETRKKHPEEANPGIVGEGLVIDEWKERRERYLARQQVEGIDSV